MRCEWAVHVVLPSEYRAVNHALSGSSLTKAAHQDVGRASWMCRVAVDVCAGGEVRGVRDRRGVRDGKACVMGGCA